MPIYHLSRRFGKGCRAERLRDLEDLAKSVRLVVDEIDTNLQLSEYASEARRVGRLIL
jgi:hypothetical protein